MKMNQQLLWIFRGSVLDALETASHKYSTL